MPDHDTETVVNWNPRRVPDLPRWDAPGEARRVPTRLKTITRRHFFGASGLGIGHLALGSLLERDGWAAAAANATHFAPKAKRIIYLFMAGAPSQFELLDHKPKLSQLGGQLIPESFIKGERFAFIRGAPRLLAPVAKFKRCGRSGTEISDLLPHLGEVADDIAVVKSVHTTQFNHGPAQIFINTGHQVMGRPSLGAWLGYGLGSENADLPGFMVLLSGISQPDGGKSCWSAGFLPTLYQGVELRSKGDPVLFLSNPEGIDGPSRRRAIDAINRLNRSQLEEARDPEIATRIAAYEMGYRMQSSVPDLVDLSDEPRSVHEMYGTQPGKASFANNCLLARRLVERGVRFVQLYHRGWDHHGAESGDCLLTALPRLCRETDRAAAALIKDLKQRGLLDDTLVVWGGEFGRTPMSEVRPGAKSKFVGRDHHARAFSVWLAGGGIRPGVTVGRTDDIGYNIVEDPVDVHDLHATILHLMGIDHKRLTFRFQGRDFRLTDVSGKVVQKIVA